MKKILVFLICISSVIGFVGCKKQSNLNEISKDNTKYQIEIDLDVNTKSAKVCQNVDYLNNTNEIFKNLKFNLYPQFFKHGATDNIVSSTKLANAYPNGMSYAEFEVLRVIVENQDVSVDYDGEYNEILNVDLKNNLVPNDRVDIQIEYSFTLPNCHHRFGYGDDTINLGNFYPILCVYENGKFVENGYSPNGDPFYSDIANYSVSITIPNEYVVASTGNKVDEKLVDNEKIVTYSANMVRDFAMVISNKFQIKSEKVNNTNVNYYYYEDDYAEQSLKTGVDAIKTFSDLFGEYPYENYSIVKNDFVHGGMEYPNLVMISDDIKYLDDYKNVIIHETAHQWWYGIVGNDEMKYPWLDEALTEFSTALFYDYNKGYNLTHKGMIETSKENYSLFLSVYKDVLGDIDTSMRGCKEYNTEPEYVYCIYVKGVMMFDSLYNLVGKTNFIKSLKIYYEKNQFKNAKPDNLINSFEFVSKTDLDGFFSSWINGKVVIR